MLPTEEFARAKLNLSLDVLGKRPDGYHEMNMVMQSVSLGDRLTLSPDGSGQVRVKSNFTFLPTGEKNLAALAALAFWRARGEEIRGLEITIEKQIPVCAGLGGGSSDAAAVLRALNRMEGEPFTREELCRLGGRVGSDVPYCVWGGTALAQGRGEVLTPLPPLPHCWAVVCKPDFSVSTPELFAAVDRVRLTRRPDTRGLVSALEGGDLAGAARRMFNVFEDVLPRRQRDTVFEIKSALLHYGALGCAMSGTGSAVFGLFETEQGAQGVREVLAKQYPDTFFCQTV